MGLGFQLLGLGLRVQGNMLNRDIIVSDVEEGSILILVALL